MKTRFWIKIWVENKSFFIASALYLLSIILIAPWGNFSISDDFYYLLQVKAFSLGIFTKSALIGPTLILQSFIGLLWTSIFGQTYIAVRILTILISILAVYAVSRILKLLEVKEHLITLGLTLIYFNQQFYPLSLTFMSENYFLLFVFISLYAFFKFQKTNNIKHLFWASVFGGLSIMVRQYGVVLFITYISTYVLTNYKKLKWNELLVIVMPFIVLGSAGIFWPKFKATSEPKSMDLSLFFTSFQSFFSRIMDKEILPYVGFFLLPFAFITYIKTNLLNKIMVLFLALPLSKVIYDVNVFNTGNLFYLESLYARHAINLRPNLFNNIPFKLVISYIIALSLVTLILLILKTLINKYKKHEIGLDKILKDKTSVTIVIALVGFYTIVMITDRVFDRYLMNFYILLTIFATYIYSKNVKTISWITYLPIVFMCAITVLLTWDYYRVNQLKWALAEKITIEKNIHRGQVFVDQEYAYTVFMEEEENYEGFKKISYGNYDRVCFVQEYIKEDKNLLNKILTKIESQPLIVKNFPVKPIDETGLMKEERNHFGKEDVLYFDNEYYSPIYNWLGKKPFVRAFCLYK